MIIFTIREYQESDLEEIVDIYKSVFSEPPWNESWTDEDIKNDLRFALSEKEPTVLVALNDYCLCGFCWGYKIPFEKFPFLQGKINQNSNYMDEIAVKKSMRIKGIGYRLCMKYLQILENNNYCGLVLRTDQRNKASMSLFKKCGLKSLNLWDPEFKERIYLYKNIGEENEK